jgi:hypothetical protein
MLESRFLNCSVNYTLINSMHLQLLGEGKFLVLVSHNSNNNKNREDALPLPDHNIGLAKH